MSRRKKPPPLGTLFLVPLRDRGFAVGVFARTDGRGIAFGYFFGPRIFSRDDVHVEAIASERALLVGRFGDLGLLRGDWQVIGELGGWSLDSWPLPPLSRVDERAGRAWMSTYSDSLHFISEEEIHPTEASRYPNERLMGAGAVELRLTRLIGEGEAQ